MNEEKEGDSDKVGVREIERERERVYDGRRERERKEGRDRVWGE